MTEKNKPKSPFGLALAARRGDLPPESLSGAAKRLYDDKTLTQDALSDYAKERTPPQSRSFVEIKRTFKRG